VKRSGRYPRVGTDRAATAVVSQAGAVPLVETTTGVDAARSEAVCLPDTRREAPELHPILRVRGGLEDDARWSPKGDYSPRTGLDARRT